MCVVVINPRGNRYIYINITPAFTRTDVYVFIHVQVLVQAIDLAIVMWRGWVNDTKQDEARRDGWGGG